MIYTSDVFDIEEAVADLIGTICKSETTDHYKKAMAAFQSCKDTQEKKKEFLEAKRRFDQVKDYGRYAPDYQPLYRKMLNAKRKLDTDENMANLRVAEREMQSILDLVAINIASEVSGSVKVDTGNPFFEKGSKKCGGKCHD